ncbi:MAG: hypothetical protein WCJ19_04575 [bacterium]
MNPNQNFPQVNPNQPVQPLPQQNPYPQQFQPQPQMNQPMMPNGYQAPYQSPYQVPLKKSKKGLFIGLIVLLIILVGAGAAGLWFFVFSKSADRENLQKYGEAYNQIIDAGKATKTSLSKIDTSNTTLAEQISEIKTIYNDYNTKVTTATKNLPVSTDSTKAVSDKFKTFQNNENVNIELELINTTAESVGTSFQNLSAKMNNVKISSITDLKNAQNIYVSELDSAIKEFNGLNFTNSDVKKINTEIVTFLTDVKNEFNDFLNAVLDYANNTSSTTAYSKAQTAYTTFQTDVTNSLSTFETNVTKAYSVLDKNVTKNYDSTISEFKSEYDKVKKDLSADKAPGLK